MQPPPQATRDPTIQALKVKARRSANHLLRVLLPERIVIGAILCGYSLDAILSTISKRSSDHDSHNSRVETQTGFPRIGRSRSSICRQPPLWVKISCLLPHESLDNMK